MKDTKIVKINGTKRLARKNIQGSYIIYLDDDDINWLNAKKDNEV